MQLLNNSECGQSFNISYYDQTVSEREVTCSKECHNVRMARFRQDV